MRVSLGVTVAVGLLGACTVPSTDGTPPPSSSSSSSSSGGSSGVETASSSRGPSSSSRGPQPPQVRPSNTACIAPSPPPVNGTVKVERAFPNLSFEEPVAMLQAPGDPSQFYVVLRRGRVQRFANTPDVSTASHVIELTVNHNPDEAGLLGMAFHPNWQQNHEVFLSYTDFNSPRQLRSVVSRFRSTDNGATFDPSTEEILLTHDQPYDNHNGGHIVFGPDGFLYIGLGDGGSGGDPLNSGQDLTSLLGKILRIDVDNGTPYAIPSSNPFNGPDQKREIFAYGLRNPWRFTFDRELGNLWVGDVGQDQWEEVDLVTRGGNYGWRIREGAHCFRPADCSTEGLIDPVYEVPHVDGRSVTGGYVYRGTRIPQLYGTYVFGDFSFGQLWGGYVDGPTPEPYRILGASPAVSSFAEGLDGELYFLSYMTGTIHTLVPGDTTAEDTFPRQLSQTGCVDVANPLRPAPGTIPYDVIDPFWSDGSVKTRFLALPDGTTIDVRDDGDFDFPVGTVLIKTFQLMGRLVETRLFMRHPDGAWAGYSYEWNDAQTDATLLTAMKEKDIAGQRWQFPSRAQCLLCHNAAAGQTLGLEIAQLNHELTYPNGAITNQLTAFGQMALFTTPLTTEPAMQDALVATDGMAPLDERARAYLHTNCAYCHRPDGPGRGNADLRYTRDFAEMRVCNEDPLEGDLNIAGAKLLVPGNPETSLLHARMGRRGVSQMPPMASSQVDPDGAALIEDWIRSINACP